MLIRVGSTNRVKVGAVRESLRHYLDIISHPIVTGRSVPSLYSGQPIGLDEIIEGAIYRAKEAFQEAQYSFGIESGLFPVPHTRTGYMDITACVIYDGEREYSGLSSAFEQPEEVTRLAVQERIEISEGWKRCGFTAAEKIGEECGSIYEISSGRADRTVYTQEAIFHALDALRNTITGRFRNH